MKPLDYLKGAAADLGYQVYTDTVDQARGVMIIPSGFGVSYEYGDRRRVITFSVGATFEGPSVGDGSCFDDLETLTDAFEADQTAGGDNGSVDVGGWEVVSLERGLVTFRASVTVKE